MSTTGRYAALIRGVSPSNAPSAELRAAFEQAGFEDVRTVLASGNVVFSAGALDEATIRERAETALEERLGRRFLTVIRSIDALRELIAADPWQAWELREDHKRVVTFLLAEPDEPPPLPPERDGATILGLLGREAFCAYIPGPTGGAFMRVIESTLGKEITTRTWDTVRRVAR